jgi:uncharacterized protein (DUF2141 family)
MPHRPVRAPVRTLVPALVLALLPMPAAAQAEILGPDAAACAPGSGRTAVLVTVGGFKNREGTLRLELWPGNQDDFMRDHHELLAEGKTYYRATVPVPASGVAKVCVPLPGPGTYALGAFHSPSGVRKFNFRQDGATFTRNPKLGLSRPKAAEVAVSYGAGLNTEAVTLNYLRGLAFKPIPQSELKTAERR